MITCLIQAFLLHLWRMSGVIGSWKSMILELLEVEVTSLEDNSEMDEYPLDQAIQCESKDP
jgi:hypothetical protein